MRNFLMLLNSMMFICISFCANTFTLSAASKILTETEISEETTAGTYPVLISAKNEKGEEKEIIVYITITTPNTVVDEEIQEGIDATPIEVEQKVLETLTKDQLIALTNAHAWNLKTGESIPLVEARWYQVTNNNSSQYRAYFATEKGTSTEVDMQVKPILTPEQSSTPHTLFEQPAEYQRYRLIVIGFAFVIFIPIPLFLIASGKLLRRLKDAEEVLYHGE